MFGSIANFFTKLSFPGFKRSATPLQSSEEDEEEERLIQQESDATMVKYALS
jgi:hypothetical protein